MEDRTRVLLLFDGKENESERIIEFQLTLASYFDKTLFSFLDIHQLVKRSSTWQHIDFDIMLADYADLSFSFSGLGGLAHLADQYVYKMACAHPDRLFVLWADDVIRGYRGIRQIGGNTKENIVLASHSDILLAHISNRYQSASVQPALC